MGPPPGPPNKPFAFLGLQTFPLAGRYRAAGGKGTGGPSYTCSLYWSTGHCRPARKQKQAVLALSLPPLPPPANKDLRGGALT